MVCCFSNTSRLVFATEITRSISYSSHKTPTIVTTITINNVYSKEYETIGLTIANHESNFIIVNDHLCSYLSISLTAFLSSNLCNIQAAIGFAEHYVATAWLIAMCVCVYVYCIRMYNFIGI